MPTRRAGPSIQEVKRIHVAKSVQDLLIIRDHTKHTTLLCMGKKRQSVVLTNSTTKRAFKKVLVAITTQPVTCRCFIAERSVRELKRCQWHVLKVHK